MKSSAKGFTLVELAIVLVVIGIIVGVVLKAQELIFNVKVKRQVSQIKELMGAVNMYYDRYGYLPGDDPTASSRWRNARDGDGDGLIEGWCVSWTEESCNVFKHLRYANLITGDPLDNRNPTNIFGGYIDIISHPAFGYKLVITLGSIPGDAAEAIDRTIDDGTCRGSVTAWDITANTACNSTYNHTHRYGMEILF